MVQQPVLIRPNKWFNNQSGFDQTNGSQLFQQNNHSLVFTKCLLMSIVSSTVGPSCTYGNWIYNYPCKKCPLPLKLWVEFRSWRCVLDTKFCDKVCQWLHTGRWFSPVSSTNKIDNHEITTIRVVNSVSINIGHTNGSTDTCYAARQK